MIDIGAWIRDGRKRLGLSQAALAERFGTSQACVSQWETGKRAPAPAERDRLKAVLGSSAAPSTTPRLRPNPSWTCSLPVARPHRPLDPHPSE